MLYVFRDGSDGTGPNGGLVLDGVGSIYGTAGGGSPNGGGIVFRLSETGTRKWKEDVLHWSRDAAPLAGVTFHSDRNLFGTAIGGQDNSGMVFRLGRAVRPGNAWTFTVLYDFKGGSDGRYPAADVVIDRAGNLYSTTQGGGNSSGGYGTVFKLAP